MFAIQPSRQTLARRSLLAQALWLSLGMSSGAICSTVSADEVETPDGGSFKRRTANELDRIEVEASHARIEYRATDSGSATRTHTELRDIPQSVSVITQDLIRDQAIGSMADVVRYVPGMGMAQGEGNRDTPIFRGNGSTADFFIDGIRDDVQYFRDVYNIERVEVLKGPNSMIFGRGGSGGVLNRVSKQADWSTVRDVSLQYGSDKRRRGSFDLGGSANERVALRVTGMLEDSGSFRDAVEIQRHGLNPTMSVDLGERTSVAFGYERFSDERVADRGVPSFQGRPVQTRPDVFFGDPDSSPVDARVDAFNALIEHEFSDGLALRNRSRWADYDKFYQNVFANGVNDDGATVSIRGYNNATQRENLFNQTDLVFTTQVGAVGHTLLAGLELGRQETDNLRQTAFFAGLDGAFDQTSVDVPLDDPRSRVPVQFRPSASDSRNHGVARVSAVYLQDQITLSPRWQAILGVRYDRFDVDFDNLRDDDSIRSDDGLLSPRAGLIWRPVAPLSLYASYSVAHQPRSGEQLTSLSLSSASLEPERFNNYELGAKWELSPTLWLNAAAYRLDRTNVAVPDPADSTRLVLVDGQRTRGVELEISGEVAERWRVTGGYSWADGEITRSQSSTVVAGNTLPQLPEHNFSLWNRFDLDARWGLGLGVIRRGDSFASTDNTVTLPGYTRVDAALYYSVNSNLQLQLNAENLFDTEYYPNAHNNNNISPGSPRAALLSVNMRF